IFRSRGVLRGKVQCAIGRDSVAGLERDFFYSPELELTEVGVGIQKQRFFSGGLIECIEPRWRIGVLLQRNLYRVIGSRTLVFGINFPPGGPGSLVVNQVCIWRI